MSSQINYVDEAKRFIASRPRRQQSVLVPFIPAIELMLTNHLSYKEIFEFVNLHGDACAYQTVVAFTKRHVGVITPQQKRIDTIPSRANPAAKQSENFLDPGQNQSTQMAVRRQDRSREKYQAQNRPTCRKSWQEAARRQIGWSANRQES